MQSLNLKHLYAVDTQNVIGDICGWLDENANDTDEADQIEFAMVRWRDDLTWTAVRLSAALINTIH